MAQADDVYTPPGHTLLTALVAWNGLDAVRDALALGTYRAFGINSDGDLIPIPREYWRTTAGRQTLETGEWNWHERQATGGRSDARYETLTVVVANPPPPAPATAPSPEPAPEKEATRGTAEWIAAEARRLKRGNKIPADITITDFAKLLGKQMERAAEKDPTLRLVGWKHINNKLSEWGLWPVARIPSEP